MELVILTKMHSITLLKPIFFALPERIFAERMEQRENMIYLFPTGKWTVGWVKNMMEHQAHWVLINVSKSIRLIRHEV